jgi:hypothetical protein
MRLMRLPDAVAHLERDLRAIFGDRFESLVTFGLRAQRSHDAGREPHGAHTTTPILTHTLAIVDQLSTDDLRACTTRVSAWHDGGLATPLVLDRREFGRSLDAFPFEFGAILADHAVVAGADPFDGLTVEAADLRRACEVQARGHWLHLREGYLETRGNSDALAVLIVESAAAFRALLVSVARLDAVALGERDAGAAARHVEHRLSMPSTASEIVALAGVAEISSADAERLFPRYLETMRRLVKYIDDWTPTP